MRFSIVFLFAALLIAAGCECFLPGGKPPEGNIIADVNNNTPAGVILDFRSAVDHFINELVRETMLNCSGAQIFVDADEKSGKAAHHVVRKSGEFSGISVSGSSGSKYRLVSRCSGAAWSMELFSPDGHSIWKRTVQLKTAI